jgi:hypothetical protein
VAWQDRLFDSPPRWSAVVALAAATGCGAGAGASGVPSAAGDWQVQLTYRRATPSDHCFARWLEIEGRGAGHGFRASAHIDQQGEALSGTLTGLDIPMTCQFAGSAAADGAVTWSQAGCSAACTTFQHPSLPCSALRVCTVDERFEGRLGARLEGTHDVFWDATDLATGERRGRVQIMGTLLAQR